MNLPPGYPSGRIQDHVAATGIPQFNAASFRPDFGGINGSSDQQKPAGLSLWLNQAHSQLNPNHIVANPSIYSSTSTNLPDIVQMGSATNIYGNSSSSSSANLGNLTLSGMPNQGLKEEANALPTSKPPSAASPMSATALLQKAAQMGSTRSNNNQSFYGNNSYGLMSSSSNNSSNMTTRNELDQVFQNGNKQQHQPSSNIVMSDSIMGSSTSTALDQLVKLQQQQPCSSSMESGLTRDFLGMSTDSGRPFSPQELAKFASISSAMGLSQFTSNP